MILRVTIITPVLNGTAFLEAAIDSVQSQYYADWRHIVVDGGSSDGTLEILEKRAALEPRLSVISRPGSGIYDALLDGFEQSGNGLLGWLNADDLIAPWTLSEAVRIMGYAEGPDWLSGLPALWDANGHLRAVQSTAWRPRGAIVRGWFHDGFLGCLQQETMFFKKTLFDKLNESERRIIRTQRLAGDFALWRAFAGYSRLTTAPVILGGFRAHGANRSVQQAQIYAKEVEALGGVCPPHWIAKRLRTIFETVSSAANVWSFRKAANELYRSLQ